MDGVEAAAADAEKELEQQTAQKSQKLQKEAAEEKIATEVKNKVQAEKSEASEDLSPMEAEIAKTRKKTELVKKQTKEMLTHGNTHFSNGLGSLDKLRAKHGEEMADFGKEQSVQAIAFGEEQLNLPLITGLAFVNVLTAGFAYSYYRSTKQM